MDGGDQGSSRLNDDDFGSIFSSAADDVKQRAINLQALKEPPEPVRVGLQVD